MEQHFREHYSQNFYWNTDKSSLTLVDRASMPVLFLGFIFGTLFVILGYYLLNLASFSGIVDFEKSLAQTAIHAPKLFPTYIFALIVLVLGFGILLAALFFTLRRKIISFDGKTLTVTDYPVIGKPHSFTESIYEYSGVRLRVKLSQHGLSNCNKFILELYHQDRKKIVPLYISRSAKNIRTLWKAYAVHFELMPIHITEQGMVSHRISDLDSDFQEVVKKWNLPKDFIKDTEHSDLLVCRRKQNTKMIKLRHPVFDAYSTLSVLIVIILCAILSSAFYYQAFLLKFISFSVLFGLYVLGLTFVFYIILGLLTKDILFIYNKRLIVYKKIFGLPLKQTVIPFALIKAVDITFMPTTARYALTIISADHTASVFNKLSPTDLRYIRGYLLYEIGELNLKEEN